MNGDTQIYVSGLEYCQGRRQVRTEGGGKVDHPWCKCSGEMSAGKGIGREPVGGSGCDGIRGRERAEEVPRL